MNAAVLAFGVGVLVVATMDAVTLVAAAVAVACDQSRNAALEDVLRDRELAAMRAADLESLVAQRMYTSSLQLPAPYAQTWRESRRDLADNYAQLVQTLHDVRAANRRGDGDRIEELVNDQLGSEHGSQSSQSEHESSQSAAGSSDEEPPPATNRRCARCGDTSNLELVLPTGPWVDAPIEARTYCRQCLHGS